MSVTIRNHNYRIETETLATGQVRAKARGRVKNLRTFAPGITHEGAAHELARRIEGLRLVEVRNLTTIESAGKAEWAIYVTTGA